jgi:hypothetical protein
MIVTQLQTSSDTSSILVGGNIIAGFFGRLLHQSGLFWLVAEEKARSHRVQVEFEPDSICEDDGILCLNLFSHFMFSEQHTTIAKRTPSRYIGIQWEEKALVVKRKALASFKFEWLSLNTVGMYGALVHSK